MSSGQVAASAQAVRSTHSPSWIDQAGLLGDRNELGRRDHAALGMVPAQQRLAAVIAVVADVDQRLVVQLELAAHDRLAQIEFQRAPRLHARVHLGLEEPIGAAAVGLGAVQRQVGVLQQLVRLGAVVRRHGDADAGVRSTTCGRRARRAAGAPRWMRSTRSVTSVGSLDRGLNDGELVAAEPRDDVGLAQAAAQPRRRPS